MTRIFAILFLIGLIGPTGLRAAVYQPTYSSSYALVVGIDTYAHWPRLEYAAKDAASMAELLEQKHFQVTILTNHQATRRNILKQLETIRRSVDANSRVVFYFAGHGQTEDLPGGRERGYIVPVDADEYDWKRTMLPMDRLNRTIRDFEAKHILLAFDSCYSGLGLSRSIKRRVKQDSVYITKMMQTRSIQVLTAGSRSEQALEAAGHGLFTDHLLAALAGAADINADGHITATEIYATLRPSITKQSHSRQTPQFGYIEGNGDIVFKTMPGSKDRTSIIVDSHIDSIDVWAGSTEIGHRLKAGRSRLAATAGATSIIVKKGGQTLYRKQVVLQANHTFTIRIGPASSESLPREPLTTRTISNRDVEDYSNSLAYDLDHDGREEIVTASGKSLYAFKADGSILWQRTFNFAITLNLIDDWHAEPAIGLAGTADGQVHLLLLDRFGQEVWHHVRKINHYHRGQPDGRGSIAKLVDIDLDGHEEIVAITTADHGLKPRGIIVYDQHANELWRYLMGPKPQSIVIWDKPQGRPDIIIGTFSSADGNREPHNQTNDNHAYVISVDNHGKTNWIQPMGDYYTGVQVLLSDSGHHRRPSLYAHTYTSASYREDEGGIYQISSSGEILQRLDTPNSILSMAMTSIDSSPEIYIYAADSKMNLYKLDRRLNLLQKKALDSSSASRHLRIAGVKDYDGDGRHDLLLYSYERLLSERNPLARPNPRTKAFYSNLNLQIYSADLAVPIKRISFSSGWNKQHCFVVADIDRPQRSPSPYMVMDDEITVYNY
jgi:hypothetical protein